MDSSETKMAIADAAAHEFVANGYAGTSMSGIASRLGLTKGALVYHFPAKADFVTHFVDVLQQTTGQAQDFSRNSYPKNGAKRLVLFSILMDEWRKKHFQVGAGISLFIDSGAPHAVAGELTQDWLAFYVDAFEQCKARRQIRDDMSALDAAEILAVTNLGAMFFGHLYRAESDDVKPFRFLRKALRSVGVPHASELTDRVYRKYRNRLPDPIVLVA